MSKFQDLITQACIAERQYREHSADTRMNCGAIVDGCLQRAGSTPERLNELRRKLEDPQQHLPGCRAFRRQVAKLFAEGRLSGGIPANSVRMNVTPTRDDAQFELVPLGHSLFELWGLACQDTEIRHPEAFGGVTDMDAWKERLEELKAVRDALFERIGQEFEPGDTIVGPPRPDGSVRVFLAVAPEVSLYPLGGLGERAVNHLLSTDAEKWTQQREEPTQIKRYARQVAG